jgi:hypothetical protein
MKTTNSASLQIPYLTALIVCLAEGLALYATFVDPIAGTSIRHMIRVAAVVSQALVIAGLLLWRRGGRAEVFLVAVTMGMMVLIMSLCAAFAG